MPPTTAFAGRYEFLNQPGEVARLMREMDWGATPFGPLDTWSTALLSAASICLGSRFPIVLYWGPELALIYNDAWSPVPGRKHPWALGRPGREVWSEIWDIIGPMFDHVMSTGEATWSDDQLLPLNRFGYVEECYFYYSYSPVRGETGAVEGVFTAVTETTFRVLAERRERLLRQVSEATARARRAETACRDAVAALADAPQESPFCATYLRHVETGELRRVAVQGLDDDAVLPAVVGGDDAGPWPFAEAARHGSADVDDLAMRFAGRLPHRPWPEPIEQGLVVAITAPGGTTAGFLVTGVSARRRLDDAYRALFAGVAGHITTAVANAQAYEAERQRAEQLAELDRAKTTFFSNASHEFRTPLTLMLGPLDEMLAQAGSGPQAQVATADLELVHRNGQRLLRLVNTLLDFARFESGRSRAEFEPVALGAMTADIASSFRSAMTQAGLAFDVDCDEPVPPVWVDRSMWEKVVLNLLSNAFKFTLQGRVSVRLRATAGGAQLEVRDSGVGIPPEHLGAVFDRFHRIEGQSGRTIEGTGIGLALVRDLVSLHGGSVRVDSRVGEGAVFTVDLPTRPPAAANLPERAPAVRGMSPTASAAFLAEMRNWTGAAPAEAPAEAPAPATGGRILLADDNADMRGYVERLLRDDGFDVEAVPDGATALARLRERLPDLLLSDVMMPALDGFGLLAAVRADAATAALPVILLSARAGEEAAVEGIDAGADDYLIKPFSARELLARVQGALRLSAQRRETTRLLRDANDALASRVAERTRERDDVWRLSRDLLGIADTDGVWLAVNPAWTATLGWEASEIVGRTSEWLEHPDDRAATRAEVSQLGGGRSTEHFENRFRTRSGDYRLLTWTAVPAGGRLHCVARDITQEREREVELEQARESLRQAQKLEALGQLTGGIAHDFNNLLASIMGALQVLGRLPDGDERKTRYIDMALRSSRTAASLTAQLLAFGRRQTLDIQAVDVAGLLAGMSDMLRRAGGEGVRTVVQVDAGLWSACTDPHQLESALLNLCINARDAMPDGGELRVTARNRTALGRGDCVELTVADTGTGMAAEVMEKVFEPFFTTKPLGKGTGLGLSMVHGFVKQSKGDVEMRSVVGEGTEVTLVLPRAEHVQPAVQGPVPWAARGEGETVLVVEDEPDVAALMTGILTDAGYTPRVAHNFQQGLAELKRAGPLALLITDVGLPGGDGRALAREARQHQPGLSALLVTGYAQDALVKADYLDDGMRMLAKPFDVDEFARLVGEMRARR